MSHARKFALISTVVWGLIFIGLLSVVLIPGAEYFADPDRSLWRLLTAAIILPGFVLNGWLGWRSKRLKVDGQLDERDDAIARTASQATLIVVTLAVYLMALSLYEVYSSTGMVPRGWLYLLAYGTVSLVCLVHAAASLVVDLRGTANG
ncbi:MAG: hypothetical protein IH600_09335 [Bacteroidetes bacterium]|nr:hypothetical protein [Bacteroidota bacterium]